MTPSTHTPTLWHGAKKAQGVNVTPFGVELFNVNTLFYTLRYFFYTYFIVIIMMSILRAPRFSFAPGPQNLRTGPASIQGKKEYKSEVKVISRLRHRNLVQLIGWCHGHGQELLLVYELMPNRSLDIHLHGKQGTFLTWPMRYVVPSILISTPFVPRYKSFYRFQYKLHTDVYKHILERRYSFCSICIPY